MADDLTGKSSPTESEDAIRHLKASQSVEMAFQGAGFPSPPGDMAAIITNHVKSAVKGLPISQIANMSPGSGALAAAALAGVDQFVSSLTPTQREAVKNGVNPLDAAAMLKFGGELNLLLNGKPIAPSGGVPAGSNGNRGAAKVVGRGGASTTFAGSLGTVTPQSFGGTPFAREGLSFSTFKGLREQGFKADHIVHAAQDAKHHGFDPNDAHIAKDFAILDKDDGKRREERNRLMDDFQAKMNRDEELNRLKAQYDGETDPEKKAVIAEQYHARGKQIGRETGFRGHIDTMPTARAKKAGDELEHEQIDKTLKGSIHNLSHGNKAEAARIARIVAEYRRHPQDAAARQNYETLKQHSDADPRSKLAMAGIEKSLTKGGDNLKERVIAKNEVKAAQKADAVAQDDGMLAALNAPADTKTAAKLEPEKAASKDEPGKPAKTEPSKPQPTKMVQAKPATLHA